MPRIFVIASGQAGISTIKPFIYLLSANGLLINSRIVPILVDTWDSPLIREAENALKLYSRIQSKIGNERQGFFGATVVGYNQLIDTSAVDPEFKSLFQAPSISDLTAKSSESVKRAWHSHIDPESDRLGEDIYGKTNLTTTALTLLLNEPTVAQDSIKPKGKARPFKNEGSSVPQNFAEICQHLWSNRGLEAGDRIVFVTSPAGGTGLSVTAELLRRMKAEGIEKLGVQAALLWTFPRPNAARHAELLDRARLTLKYFKDSKEKEEMLPVQHLYLVHHPNAPFTTDLTALALLDCCINEQDKRQGYASDLSRKNWTALARLEAAVKWFDPWKGLRQRAPEFFEAFIGFGNGFKKYMHELRVRTQAVGFQFPISPVTDKPFRPIKKAGKNKGEQSPQYLIENEMGKTSDPSEGFLKGLTHLAQDYLLSEMLPNPDGEQEKGSSWESTRKWPENLNYYTWLDLSRWVPSVRAKVWLSGYAVQKVADNPAGAAVPFQQMVSDILDLIDLKRKTDEDVEAPVEDCFQGDTTPQSEIARKVLGIPDGGDLKVLRWSPKPLGREQVLGFQHPDTLYVPAPELEKSLLPLQHNLSVDGRLLFDRTTPPHISEELQSHIREQIQKGQGKSLQCLLDKKFQVPPEADPASGEPEYYSPEPALFAYQSKPGQWEDGQYDLWYLPYSAASYLTASPETTPSYPHTTEGNSGFSISSWAKVLSGIFVAAVVIWLVLRLVEKPHLGGTDQGNKSNPINDPPALRPTTETIGTITYTLDTSAQPGVPASVSIAPNTQTQTMPSGSPEAKQAWQIKNWEEDLQESLSSENPAKTKAFVFDYLEVCRFKNEDGSINSLKPDEFRGSFLPAIAGRLTTLRATDTRYKYLKTERKWVLTEITIDDVRLRPK
jgi:hypothetical protein